MALAHLNPTRPSNSTASMAKVWCMRTMLAVAGWPKTRGFKANLWMVKMTWLKAQLWTSKLTEMSYIQILSSQNLTFSTITRSFHTKRGLSGRNKKLSAERNLQLERALDLEPEFSRAQHTFAIGNPKRIRQRSQVITKVVKLRHLPKAPHLWRILIASANRKLVRKIRYWWAFIKIQLVRL